MAEQAESQNVAVLLADIVDSTRLSAEQGMAYRKVNQILLREIAAVTSAFGGVVINYTGDGGVVGFLGPGFNLANDLVFDAATTLVADIYGLMNPMLEEGIRAKVLLEARPLPGSTGSRTADIGPSHRPRPDD